MDERSTRHYLAPRYWGIWLGFLILRALSLLPFRWQMMLGKTLGRWVFRLAGERRRIASRNLRLCFPEWQNDERKRVLIAHFENLGISLFEMAMAYYRPQRFDNRIAFEGLEQLLSITPGSVILLTAHFGALEVGGCALKAEGLIFDAVYRKDRNPLVNELIRRGREQASRRTIEKSNIKEMVRSLRANVPVWYAPDQNYRRKQSEILTFFGVPAMTNTATSSLARLGKATVIGFFPHRRADLSGYDIVVTAPLDDFPGESASDDTRRITAVFETQIRRSPEQYFWVHRKFKDQPESGVDRYANLEQEDQP